MGRHVGSGQPPGESLANVKASGAPYSDIKLSLRDQQGSLGLNCLCRQCGLLNTCLPSGSLESGTGPAEGAYGTNL